MRYRISKILLIIIGFITVLSCFENRNVNAATSSPYKIMDNIVVTTGLSMDNTPLAIKNYLLLKYGTPCDDKYKLGLKTTSDGKRCFYGILPDNTRIDENNEIKEITSTCGEYISAYSSDRQNQVIFVNKLNEGKTINDCLKEAFKVFPGVEDANIPNYQIIDSNPMSPEDIRVYLYENFMFNNKSVRLRYFAIDVIGKPIEITHDNIPSEQPNIPQDSNPTPDNPNKLPEDSGPQNVPQPNNNGSIPSRITPLTICFITIGSLAGLYLLYELYKIIKVTTVWFKK